MTMTLLKSLLVACALAVAGPATAQAADRITGVWQHHDDNGRVDALIALTERDGTIEGRIQQVFPAPGAPDHSTCTKCTGSLRGAPIIGLRILSGLRPTGGRYEDGRILDPQSGTEYRLTAELSPDGRSLSLRGFVGVSLFGRTQVWTRRS